MGFFSKIKLKHILDAKPVSNQFGCDRGKPIDRYFIEKFLKTNSAFIKGDVLEIAENTYTKQFGKDITSSLIFTYDKQNPADVTGDLCDTSTLKSNSANCFICTQTFNFIYDFESVIKGAHFILKPGGTLLATVACMAPISKYDADRWGDFWRFTPQGCEAVFGKIFGKDNVEVKPMGNSAAASLFMKGYALEDLGNNVDLDYNDELFPLVIGIKAIK